MSRASGYATGDLPDPAVQVDKMIEIANHIHEGAMAFLSRQYTTMALFVMIVFMLLGWFLGSWTKIGRAHV